MANETIADIIAWLRRPREGENAYLTLWRDEIADRLEAAHRRERGDAAIKRERRLLMSCARWILCHDIYGHTAKELLSECKEVLNDDGQFLFKEDEQ